MRAQLSLKATGVLVSAGRPSALRKFGSGWISGALSMMFGLIALGTVIVMSFPGVFTLRENAGRIGHPAFRVGMFVLMVLAVVFFAAEPRSAP